MPSSNMDPHIRRILLIMIMMDVFITAGASMGLLINSSNWGYRLALGGGLPMLVFLLAALGSSRLRDYLNRYFDPHNG